MNEPNKEGARYGLLAEFDGPKALVKALEELHDRGFRRVESYTPYPVEGVPEALHFRPWPVPLIFLIAGVSGAGGGFLMQLYASAISYPENIGGRPLDSWPSFIPVTFEMGILAGVLCGVLGMLMLNQLPRYHHPVSNVARFRAASSDGFFLCVEAEDPNFEAGTTTFLLREIGAIEISEVEA